MPPDPDASAGFAYWSSIPATEDGMLGGVPSWDGFGGLSRIDLLGSRTFLARLGITSSSPARIDTALDAGAGIGRISKGLLSHVASAVDVIEPEARFTADLASEPFIRTIFNVGLQSWLPPPDTTYDLIWTQWCLGHLSDAQLVSYLTVCASVLRPNGIIVVKENMSTSDTDDFDETDSSLTRADTTFRRIFAEAHMQIIRTDEQRGLPRLPDRHLLPVRMYALKPAK